MLLNVFFIRVIGYIIDLKSIGKIEYPPNKMVYYVYYTYIAKLFLLYKNSPTVYYNMNSP